MSLAQRQRKDLNALLLEHGGEQACLVEDDDRFFPLLVRGMSWPASPSRVRVRKGRAHRCHGNSGAIWKANKGRCSIVTGYALSDGRWVQHSWVWDTKHRRVIETTFKRQAYFGYELTATEALEFIQGNRPEPWIGQPLFKEGVKLRG